VRKRHAFWPWVNHKETEQQEVTLLRVEVNPPQRARRAIEEAVHWLTPCTPSLTT
jgi:hypothetical protein